MGKFVGILIVVALIVLSAEGGYYVALRQSRLSAEITSDKNSEPLATSSKNNPPEIPNFMISSNLGQLLNEVPKDNYWQSLWSFGVWGKLESISEDLIVMDFSGKMKTYALPDDSKVTYMERNETDSKSNNILLSQIKRGDDVVLNFGIDTLTGSMDFMVVTRIIE